MSGSTTVARSPQHRSQDTLRWGGRLGVSGWGASPSSAAISAALANAQGKQGKQLVNAHWRWPVSWRVALLLQPSFDPLETGELDVTFDITIGSGDAQLTVQRTLVIPASAAHIYTSTIDNTLALPACDLLVTVSAVTQSDSHSIAANGSVEIGAFVAPETEPHAMLQMLECLCRLEGSQGADHREGDWMPPGFTPEELAYRR